MTMFVFLLYFYHIDPLLEVVRLWNHVIFVYENSDEFCRYVCLYVHYFGKKFLSHAVDHSFALLLLSNVYRR